MVVAGRAIPLPLRAEVDDDAHPRTRGYEARFASRAPVEAIRLVAIEPERFVAIAAEVYAEPAWDTLAPSWHVGPLSFPPRGETAAASRPIVPEGWAVRVDAAEGIAVSGSVFTVATCGVVRLDFTPPLDPGPWLLTGTFVDEVGRPALVAPRLLASDATSPLDALAVLHRRNGPTYDADFTLTVPVAALLLRPREQAGTVTIPRLALRKVLPGERVVAAVPGLARALAAIPSRLRWAPKVRPPRRAKGPSVSVVTATRDAPHHLRRFLATLAATRYAPLDLTLVDNGTTDPEALRQLEEATRQPSVRVLRDPRRFNFAALSNLGAATASGEVLVFANNDVAFDDQDWLGPLVEAALDPAIGVAGARLTYPDGRVQHAGIVLAGEARVRHAERFLPARHPGWHRRQRRVTDVAAVTGALMAIETRLFAALGGFDAGLGVLLNDADLCLRARAQGRRTVLVSAATAVHHESATIGPRRPADLLARGGPLWAYERALEAERFRARWSALLDADPCYPAGLDPLAADFRRRR